VERTGCNAKLVAKGVQVLAHENVKQNLAGYHPPGDAIAPPTRTYDHDVNVKLDFDVAVPGTGPTVTGAELAASTASTTSCLERNSSKSEDRCGRAPCVMG
jgi:hypothetical protein